MVRLGVLKAFVLAFVVVKLVFALVVPPNSDEAYYWLWGQHLDLSYFDHAPLVGWMQGLAALPFGWSLAGLRVFTFVTLAGTAIIFRYWAKRLGGEGSERWFWTSLAIYLASPLFFALTSPAYPDHWLLFLSLCSVHFFARAFADTADAGPARAADLYFGALFLGLAALSKYNAVIVGVSVALLILARRDLRVLLRNPHLYVAALLSVAMLTPIFVWNSSNSFVSFRFQLWERYGAGLGSLNLTGALTFVLLSLLFLSPLLVVPLARFLLRRSINGFGGVLAGLGKTLFWVSTLPMAALSLFVTVAPHWNLLAFPVFTVFAQDYLKNRLLLLAHLVLGLVAVTAITAYYAGFPLSNVSGAGEREASRLYGWPEIGERMVELQAEHDAAALGAVHYGPASKLAFGLKRADIVSLSTLTDQFDYWRDDVALAGRDILVVGDDIHPVSAAAGQFTSMEVLESFTVSRFGQPVATYDIALGRGYIAP